MQIFGTTKWAWMLECRNKWNGSTAGLQYIYVISQIDQIVHNVCLQMHECALTSCYIEHVGVLILDSSGCDMFSWHHVWDSWYKRLTNGSRRLPLVPQKPRGDAWLRALFQSDKFNLAQICLQAKSDGGQEESERKGEQLKTPGYMAGFYRTYSSAELDLARALYDPNNSAYRAKSAFCSALRQFTLYNLTRQMRKGAAFVM